jgi:hypothetical protein
LAHEAMRSPQHSELECQSIRSLRSPVRSSCEQPKLSLNLARISRYTFLHRFSRLWIASAMSGKFRVGISELRQSLRTQFIIHLKRLELHNGDSSGESLGGRF